MTDTELPVFPGDRDARCPFDPAPEYKKWRQTGGLRKVNWNGDTVWAVSRYEDIAVAMTDPRISAEVAAQQATEATTATTCRRSSRTWMTRSTPCCGGC